jgi:phthalate 4,5-cis-dihydrodiol dehydrogenase
MADARIDDDKAPIRLGIAGLGLAGAFMIRAAAVHPRIKLCAAADPLSRPRMSFMRDFGGTAYTDFRELCQDGNVEAIYIATPHQFHAEHAIAAMTHGKHVIVEKPLALTLEDCDAVIDAQQRAGMCLIVGHTHAFDPNVRAIRRIIRSGELGRLSMILTFNYTDFLYRPRRPEELDTAQGGGIIFNQVTHQIESVRLIGGGLVRNVRAQVGILDPARPTEGNSVVFLEFEDGVAASLIYSAYDYFDSDELHDWVAEGGAPKAAGRQGNTRHALSLAPDEEAERQRNVGYGGWGWPIEQPHQPHFGVLIATCERGDLRVSADGLMLYGLEGKREIPVERGVGRPGQGDVLDSLWAILREGGRNFHDARWGKATLEVALATLRSARQRREVTLLHQVAVGD